MATPEQRLGTLETDLGQMRIDLGTIVGKMEEAVNRMTKQDQDLRNRVEQVITHSGPVGGSKQPNN